MHLHMHCTTPSVYLDVIEQNDCKVVKGAIPQVISNNKELQPITTMYFQ